MRSGNLEAERVEVNVIRNSYRIYKTCFAFPNYIRVTRESLSRKPLDKLFKGKQQKMPRLSTTVDMYIFRFL